MIQILVIIRADRRCVHCHLLAKDLRVNQNQNLRAISWSDPCPERSAGPHEITEVPRHLHMLCSASLDPSQILGLT